MDEKIAAAWQARIDKSFTNRSGAFQSSMAGFASQEFDSSSAINGLLDSLNLRLDDVDEEMMRWLVENFLSKLPSISGAALGALSLRADKEHSVLTRDARRVLKEFVEKSQAKHPA
jgi:hypothetical protein